MKIIFTLIFVIVSFVTCSQVTLKEKSIKLGFVDEYVLKDSMVFKNTIIGGLSGIDYNNGVYYMVVDDNDLPRVVTAKVAINNDTISGIDFIDVIHISDSIPYFKNRELDLESVFVDENNHINIVSEGSVKNGQSPSIFSMNNQGLFVGAYAIPEYFKANSFSKPRHSAVFEASCQGVDKKGFWIGMEGVLGADGEAPSQVKENPPARITFYNKKSKDAMSQFAYPLDYIERPFKGSYNVNGVTAMLEYAKNEFLIIERAFQSGYGNKGNIVKIYRVVLDKDVTNTLYLKSLKKQEYVAVKKELIFDFDNVRDKLTDGIIDNIEGMTLGPKLANGNQSLLLVTDDNFQKHGKQLNQFILLEISR